MLKAQGPSILQSLEVGLRVQFHLSRSLFSPIFFRTQNRMVTPLVSAGTVSFGFEALGAEIS